LKAGQASFEAENATVHFKRVSKVCQCIRGLEDRMLKVQHQRFEGFWLHIKNYFLKLGHENWKIQQPCTGVMSLHYIADAESWRKQMVIFCMLKTIRTLSSVIEDFNFIVV
jgi:hypothetical protein